MRYNNIIYSGNEPNTWDLWLKPDLSLHLFNNGAWEQITGKTDIPEIDTSDFVKFSNLKSTQGLNNSVSYGNVLYRYGDVVFPYMHQSLWSTVSNGGDPASSLQIVQEVFGDVAIPRIKFNAIPRDTTYNELKNLYNYNFVCGINLYNVLQDYTKILETTINIPPIKEYASVNDFPKIGISNFIYVATDTNLTYRWSGSKYTEISPSIALGFTENTAFRGDLGSDLAQKFIALQEDLSNTDSNSTWDKDTKRLIINYPTLEDYLGVTGFNTVINIPSWIPTTDNLPQSFVKTLNVIASGGETYLNVPFVVSTFENGVYKESSKSVSIPTASAENNRAGLLSGPDKVIIDSLPGNIINVFGANSYTADKVVLHYTKADKSVYSGKIKYSEPKSLSLDIPGATSTKAGVMSAADKAKLDAISPDTALYEIVTELPIENISTNKIYLVKKSEEGNDKYTEYIYANDAWEKIGVHEGNVDLSGYVPKVEGKGLSTNDYTNEDKAIIDGLPDTIIRPTRVITSPAHNYVYGKKALKSNNYVEGEEEQILSFSVADANRAGLMSVTDKIKLDNIEANANNYILPIASSTVRGGVILNTSWQKPVIDIEDDNNENIPFKICNMSSADGTLKPSVKVYFDVDPTMSSMHLMSSGDILNAIHNALFNYAVPPASSSTTGGIKIAGKTDYGKGESNLAYSDTSAAYNYPLSISHGLDNTNTLTTSIKVWVDATPTENSPRLMTSGDIYTALQNINIPRATNSVMGGLLVPRGFGPTIIRTGSSSVPLEAKLRNTNDGFMYVDTNTYIDEVPTENSNKFILSGAVYNALQNISGGSLNLTNRTLGGGEDEQTPNEQGLEVVKNTANNKVIVPIHNDVNAPVYLSVEGAGPDATSDMLAVHTSLATSLESNSYYEIPSVRAVKDSVTNLEEKISVHDDILFNLGLIGIGNFEENSYDVTIEDTSKINKFGSAFLLGFKLKVNNDIVIPVVLNPTSRGSINANNIFTSNTIYANTDALSFKATTSINNNILIVSIAKVENNGGSVSPNSLDNLTTVDNDSN